MKNKRVRICEASMVLLCHHSKAMMDRIVTMVESTVSFHIPRTSSKASSGLRRDSLG
jgi:hypothetical protein